MKISLQSDPRTKKPVLSVSHSYSAPNIEKDATEQRTAHVQINLDPKKAGEVAYILERTEAIIEKIIRHVYFKNQV